MAVNSLRLFVFAVHIIFFSLVFGYFFLSIKIRYTYISVKIFVLFSRLRLVCSFIFRAHARMCGAFLPSFHSISVSHHSQLLYRSAAQVKCDKFALFSTKYMPSRTRQKLGANDEESGNGKKICMGAQNA